MAISTKDSEHKLWAAYRHSVNNTLVIQGYSDTLNTLNGRDWMIQISAIVKRDSASHSEMVKNFTFLEAKDHPSALIEAEKLKV